MTARKTLGSQQCDRRSVGTTASMVSNVPSFFRSTALLSAAVAIGGMNLSASAGLLRWWKMDEDAGSTTMTDSIGLQSGTYINSPTLNGSYATFNGSDQWARIAVSGSSIFNSAYERARSMGMWVKLDNTSRAQSFFGTTVPSGGHGWSFDLNANGTLNFTRWGSAGYTSTASAGLEPGVWAHVGYTLNGTLRFYVNGQQVGNAISASNAYTNFGEPTVGLGSSGGSGKFLGGSMADVRYVVSGYGPALGASNGMTGFTDGALTAANMQALAAIKPIDGAAVSAGTGGTIAAGGGFTISNAAASGDRIRDAAVVAAVPTLSGDAAGRFSYAGSLTVGDTIAAGGSLNGGTVTFTDSSNLLNGAVATASLSGLEIARESMSGFTVDGSSYDSSSGGLSYTVESPVISGNTAALGVAQTASASDLAGLSSETVRGVAGALGTTATLRAGTADSGTAVSQTWRLRSGTASETADLVLSDIVDLTTPTASNAFVLEMSYDPADIPAWASEEILRLGWKDESQGGRFVNAIAGNADGGAFSQFIAGGWDSSYATPGYYGLDTENNVAWAVIDHNSEFAVVPEPAGITLLAIGCLAGLSLRRRKS